MPIKNLDIEFHDIDGKPILDGDKPLLMRAAVVNSLMGQTKDENPSGEEKAKRYALAMRLNKGGEQELSPEEITLIKQLVGVMYAPVVVGPTYEYLNK